ncbi:deleted in malignant brain tumors 1 protein-like [Lampris incognitus]|uniref:deleted in malignant brain tumors 1 protein-like n=1 Tax=Lampris incognitus TaxID=2546036 RepID=UPI0024B4A6EE|nr:deleted in malignant brain tumors 1 protein-like [Lampris incognitus]
MDCGSPLAVKYRAYFGEGSEQVWLDDVECVGNEKSINSCQHRGYGENDCSHAEDAGVLCSEKVRLVNTTNRCSGPLEVFHDGQWGRICSSGWNMKEAVVVCNELFCGKPDLRQIHNFIGGHGQRAYTSSCSGTESSISDCPLRHNSDGCENVVVTCTGLPQLKLTNGTDKCSGRVEILHDGQWGTVCDDHWDIKDAEVVCRALDCGTVQAAKTSAFFGRGSGEIWLDDVECLGNETSLGHCQHSSYGDNNCGHSEDAGVVCSSTIRLLNGSDHCSGRVEVNRDGLWSPLYATNWGLNEAEVMCREMNCGDPIRATYENVENVGVRGYTVSCSGRELTIAQCSMREAVSTSHNRIGEAKVECSGAVKLVEGYSQCDGKVEFYHNNQWGTVCGESWDLMEASVVCHQLKCGHVHKVTQIPHLGHDSEKLWIDEISCRGRESSLTECAQRGFGDNTCNRTLVAGVVCSDSLAVRLVNSNDQCSGRLEILHAGQWGTVCERHWTMDKAEMVCNLLECGNASISSGGAQFGQGTGPIWDASDLCFDNGTSFKECSLKGFNSINCGHEEDVGIVCAEKLRLVNGRSDCSGRVELFHDGIWGTVCDDDWEISNAEVVCRQLGCGQPLSALKDAHFGKGSGPIWLDNVVCTGQESALTQCSHFDFGENNCGHGEDASVICLGTPPKPQIAMNPGPEVSFGDKMEISCTMMTEHLGGTFTLQKTSSSFKMERYSDNEATVFTIPKVDFSHQGSYHCSYRKRLATQTIAFPPGNSAELSVKVTLEQPTISLTSPNAMVMFSPENVEVKRGSRFSLTCSIQSKYPAGFFHLTKLNETAREPKPAFSHSIFFLAYFTFPSVNDHDQGDYSCVYTVNISTMFFTSVPSRPLQVMVTASSLPSAISGAVGGLLLLLLLFFVVYVVWRRREQSARAMVRFSNRIGDVIKKEKDEKEDGVLDGRDYNTLENEYGNGRSTEDRGADVASHQSVDRNATEDLTGRICYELEPLIHS